MERYHLKNVISVIREGFVLPYCQREHDTEYKAGKLCTIIHFPLRSFSVLSAGAAIVVPTDSELTMENNVEKNEVH